jgi:hypothetical protein
LVFSSAFGQTMSRHAFDVARTCAACAEDPLVPTPSEIRYPQSWIGFDLTTRLAHLHHPHFAVFGLLIRTWTLPPIQRNGKAGVVGISTLRLIEGQTMYEISD